tara:strand:- start:4151 stop:5131 length:981 start_codon:yes stop_codon:yes gene_type:complete
MASLINRRIEDTYQFLLQVEGDLLQNGSGSTGEINMSGSSFISGSFSGDGSNLTGIVSGSLVSGSNRSIQFNNTGSLDGASKFFYDPIFDNVGIDITNPTEKLHVNGNQIVTGQLVIGGYADVSASMATYSIRTGTNTFQGDQNIEGQLAITGYPDVSASMATYSIRTGANTFQGDQTINGQLGITGYADVSASMSTYSILTGANTFQGNQTINGQLGIAGYSDVSASLATYSIRAGANTFQGDQTINGNLAITGYSDVASTMGTFITTTGANTFQGDQTVNGTVSVTEVLKLSNLDVLPAGQLGSLAVYANSLYFHNGASWNVIS